MLEATFRIQNGSKVNATLKGKLCGKITHGGTSPMYLTFGSDVWRVKIPELGDYGEYD